ncbi:hypothetical protein [Micromonospora sp. WMMD998]|uniref:hypothetical protein n=1 Tax=Micromonospora sp. WMMD998 TaxID=3016092 RepID=UPI00249B65B1|nr:hypothetical protein [Micromonospora sp. WMMD998]WFE39125.1 hypothetical protein O7619_12090 [Micromonospora sp. WMMD998]
MTQPPTGADGQPPQPPGGTVYGNRPTPPPYGPAQAEPARPQQHVPGQYAPGASGSGGYAPGGPGAGGYAPGGPGSGSYGAAPFPAPAQPMPAPPVPVPPVSGAGYPQPMSAPPGSGPGYEPQPMSGPPGAVPPYGPAGPYGPPAGAPAGGGRGRTTLVLGLVAGLLLVLGGVMTTLYVTTNSKLTKAEQQVSQRDGTISANQREIDRLKGEMKTVQERLADTEQDLTGTKNDRDEQARQKKVIGDCLNKLTTALAAASRGDKAAFEEANKGLDKVCDEAENYL